MLDLKQLRKDPKKAEAKLRTKVADISIFPILKQDEKLRKSKTLVDELKAKRNHLSKQIGMKKKLGENVEKIMREVGIIGDQITKLDREISQLEMDLNASLAFLPNLPMDEVPVDLTKEKNLCIKTWGEKPTFPFSFKNHLELNQKLNLFDFNRGAKLAGSGWPLYVGFGARLEWALLNYMLATHRKNGFTQVIPPLLSKPEVMFGSAQLPKFENQLYKIRDEDHHLYLIPTAEVSLNGMHLGEVLKEEKLSLKYTAFTPCFRREAGAAGTQERGLIRMHQFNKVELFCLTKPEKSGQIFEEMLLSAEEILQGLHLHYRNMLLSTGDMSFAAAKTVDIEVWLPGQNCYMEVSSVSDCTDFQARRSQIRYCCKGEKPKFVHTLNGSGLATSRLMVALLENNQQEDGSILVPKVLHQYLEEEIVKIIPR